MCIVGSDLNIIGIGSGVDCVDDGTGGDAQINAREKNVCSYILEHDLDGNI